MRINRQSLIRVIHNTIEERTRLNRNIIAIYLGGSVLGDDYSLGGAIDIDLFFIYGGSVDQEREIVRLTDEVHLDIAHHKQSLYRDTRKLRIHPWMGPNIYNCDIYYDPSHFMDFTQASVRGQFERPDYVISRARALVNSARQIWFTYEGKQPKVGPPQLLEYLKALRNAANAIASLNGPPLTERRFLIHLPQRTQAVNQPDLFSSFTGLLGAQNIDPNTIQTWLSAWGKDYQSIPANSMPPRLHPVRKFYYMNAIREILESEHPFAALWPLILTWTQIADILQSNHY